MLMSNDYVKKFLVQNFVTFVTKGSCKMEGSVNILEEQAIKRQEKLKSLKRKQIDRDYEKQERIHSMNLPRPKFRSYKPQDKNLVEHVLPKADASDVRLEVKDLLALTKSEVVIDQLDISTLAPRQPDWDLKRDVSKKLEKLEKRTQKAMAELIRERLKAKQDLSEIVNSNPGTNET